MAFQVSPGVLVQEKDLTNIVPAVSTSIGAYAFNATRGPVGEVTLISNEQDLVSVFGKPTKDNFEEYFTASSFLQYCTYPSLPLSLDSSPSLSSFLSLDAFQNGILFHTSVL